MTSPDKQSIVEVKSLKDSCGWKDLEELIIGRPLQKTGEMAYKFVNEQDIEDMREEIRGGFSNAMLLIVEDEEELENTEE